MGERLYNYRLVKETTAGVIPASPVAHLVKFESDGMALTQASEKNPQLGNGSAAPRSAYGVRAYSGTMGVIIDTDNAPILYSTLIGDALTKTDATADTHPLATTAFAKGDMINHSDGIHTLVCYVAGTSSATEPTLAVDISDRGNTVVDGSVTWIIMPLLKKYTGERSECQSTVTLEREHREGCPVGTSEYDRYRGMFFKSLPLTLTGDTISQKASVDAEALAKDDSILDDTYEELSAKAGYTEKTTEDDAYTYEDSTFKLDGVAATGIDSCDVTINNSQVLMNELNQSKRRDQGIFDISGNISGLFSSDLYEKADAHTVMSAEFLYEKANGCSLSLKVNNIEGAAVERTLQTDKNSMLTIPFGGFDTTSQNSITYTIISPTDW